MNKIIHIGVLGSAAIAKRSVIPAILELESVYNEGSTFSFSLDFN